MNGEDLYSFIIYTEKQSDEVKEELDSIMETLGFKVKKPAKVVRKTTETSKIDECDTLEGLFEREKCIKEIAVSNTDETLCAKMNVSPTSLNSIEFDCYTEIALAQTDASVCESYIEAKAKTMPSRFKCYTEYAIQQEDDQHCALIEDADMQEDCVHRVEVITKYPDYDKSALANSTWDFIAKKTNNEAFCEYVQSSFSKEDCFEYFE